MEKIMQSYIKYLTLLLMLALYSNFTTASTTVCNANGCVITVDWAIDEEPASNNHTCDYTQGGLFLPDTTGSGAGKCTFRRALREAGARSDEGFCPGCTPVQIRFALNGTNGDGDDVYYNVTDDQWVLPVQSGAGTSDFKLKPQSITDVDGPLNIQGPTIDVLNGEMPKIVIDSGKTLEIELSEVTIRNMGFMGGMSIQWKEANGVFVNNTWGLSPNGMSIEFGDLAGNTDNLAGSHGILTTNKGDNMLVQNNVISGAATYAVEISSSTTGVQILDNLIGTRIDGTVPVVPQEFKCRTFTNINPVDPPIDSSEWFGGAGISAAGTGLLIQGNTIAGIQTIHSTFSTPPGSLQVLGRLHTVELNIIGKDTAGYESGVCGQGIQISTQRDTNPQVNNGHMILDNEIYAPRNGFDNTKGAILWSDTTVNSFRDGGNTIRRNTVKTGLEKYIEFGPLLTTPLRLFEPAEVTSISGVNISGGSHLSNIMGDPSPCPNCIIDFYLDDGDVNMEALQHLGSTMADSNGDFNFTLSASLPDGFGIRTTSTSTADDVLPNAWSGQTSEMSTEVYGVISDLIFKNGFDID